ncbi:hypothetical protein V8G54_031510 [Vigna mungo]|uniref:Cytochrome b561 domain-containing protein n=1 Tax=Vigna mungo TaxID=3915 RepID=A0AAQ3MJV5_VIGMU
MGVQQKLISFFFHASLVFIMFPLFGSSQEHQQITSSPSRTKDNNHIKMSPRLQFEITLHGFLLWASMGFLMPVGILAIRLSNKKENSRRHRIVFYVHSILQASISKSILHHNSKSNVIIDCFYWKFFYFNLKTNYLQKHRTRIYGSEKISAVEMAKRVVNSIFKMVYLLVVIVFSK